VIYITKGITKEEFDILKPKCNCPDKEIIKWQERFRYYSIPKYIKGHQNKGKPSPNKNKPMSEEQKRKISESNKGRRIYRTTKEEFDRLKPLCNCPDHEEIPWKEYYENYGIPKYLKGHSAKKYKSSEAEKYYDEYKTKWNKEHQDWYKNYNLENKEHIAEYRKNYYNEHKEEINKRSAEKQRINPEIHSKYTKKWNIEHPDKCRESCKKYFKTPKGKESNRLHNSKWRTLGYIQLNKYFEGSHGHHIDREHVIFIPSYIHRSVCHNVWSNKNMEIINTIAFFCLVQQNIDEIKDLFV